MQAVDGAGHPLGLVVLVVGVVAHDAVALAEFAPQLLRPPPGVVGDDGVGRVEDDLGAAVVLVEHDGGDIVERLLELVDVAHIGAAPAVDRLVVVAHGSDGAGLLGQDDGQLVLGDVGVLVLVDEDVLEALLIAAQHIGVVAEQLHGLHEQIVEVHRPGAVQARLVVAVHLGMLAVEDVRCPSSRFVGVDEFVLPEADDAVHPARREALGVEAQIADDVAGEAFGIGLVVDAERTRVAEQVGVGPQDAHARGMERADPHLVRHGPHQHCHALAHLGRGLVGERDGEDLHRVHTLFDEVGDAMGEHPGLARTSAGHHQQRPAPVHDGVELVGVEAQGSGGFGGHDPSILWKGSHMVRT